MPVGLYIKKTWRCCDLSFVLFLSHDIYLRVCLIGKSEREKETSARTIVTRGSFLLFLEERGLSVALRATCSKQISAEAASSEEEEETAACCPPPSLPR